MSMTLGLLKRSLKMSESEKLPLPEPLLPFPLLFPLLLLLLFPFPLLVTVSCWVPETVAPAASVTVTPTLKEPTSAGVQEMLD